jgi:HEPN domain-containing protein
MNTSLKHLSPRQQRSLQRVIAIIIRAIQPEKILLFGVYASAGSDRPKPAESPAKAGLPASAGSAASAGSLASVGSSATAGSPGMAGAPSSAGSIPAGAFSPDALPPALGAYDLLVVSGEGDRRTDYELQDLIENRCREAAPVTVLVHDIGYVNRKLEEGQYFFYSVIREGILLYDRGRTPFAPAAVPDWEEVRRMAGRDFERWGQQAHAFYHSARFNYDRGEDRAAIFLLHQAAEQLYQAILLAFTGYKPTTHNLDKLRRYTNRFSLELALVFPRDSEREDDLFKLLLAGYVEARYKEDFSIRHEELGILLERVGRLLTIAERICGNHINGLANR